ncbi:hypothetical protein BH23VER1_BH23VER1_12350 [soil metagenome]
MTTTLGQEVPIAKIDASLRALWEHNDAPTRASLTNFAIYSECDDCLATNSGLIGEITDEHACRALLIASRPGSAERRVQAWITAHCQLGDGGRKSVCSEQIAFLLEGSDGNMLRNIVFAHLDSDLPLIFWWQGALTEVFTDRLYSLIDRLIIDSSEWRDPAEQFPILSEARKDPSSRFILYDLTWGRLMGFRLALGGIFDDPAALAALPALSAVTITHSKDGALAAALFLAWIAHNLKWSVTSRTTATAPGGREIRLSLAEDATAPGTLARIELTTDDSSFVITRKPDSRFLKATINADGHSAEQIYPAPPDDQASLVIQQLTRGGNNQAYFGLLPTALSFVAR